MILDEMIIEGYISETNQDRILAPLQLLDTVRKWYLSSNAADLTDVFTMNKGPLGSQKEVIEGSSWMYQNGNDFLRDNHTFLYDLKHFAVILCYGTVAVRL